MKATSLLITGATGLLGTALVPEAVERGYRVTALHCRPMQSRSRNNFVQMDITQRERVLHLLDQVKPKIILHSAASTDVDRCELEPEWAEALNVQATATLAGWAAASGAFMVYISTDSVFDGLQGGYGESDAPAPINQYAKTKWLGEEAVRRAGPNHLIARTNFYGWSMGDKLSLGEWILRSFLRQEPIKTFTDVRFSPLYTGHLASLLFDLIEAKAQGTYHVGSREACSKHEFALLVSDAFNCRSEMNPVSVDTFHFRAARPKDTSFNVARISEFLRRPMPSLEEGMMAFKEQYKAGKIIRDTSAWHVSSI